MTNRTIINMPQFSINDESAVIIKWHKNKGDFVVKGEIICTAETTKATFEIEAEVNGHFVPMTEAGKSVKIGNPLAVISSDNNDSLKAVKKWLSDQVAKAAGSNDYKAKKYTKKAMVLAKRLGFDINSVTSDGEKTTEKDILKYYDKIKQSGKLISSDAMDLIDDIYTVNKMEKILIVGGGDGAVQILDAIRAGRKQRAVGIVDDNPKLKGKTIMGVPVPGKIEVHHLANLYKTGRFDSAVISISTDIFFREKIFNEFQKEGIPFSNIIHPTAYIGLNVSLGTGNIILAFSHIGACSKIGNNNFLSSYTNIEHHNILGNNCSFGPGVLTSSSVKIGNRVRFGTGIFIEPFIEIDDDCTIASGSILTRNIPKAHVVKSHGILFIRKKQLI